MLYIIIIIAILFGGYFAYQYFLMHYAFREIIKELSYIQQDISQNQILHLPIPDRHLRNLLVSFNSTLKEIQKERRGYLLREKEFKKQIENISHDLRTPLTVILGYLKLMNQPDMHFKNNEQLRETIQIIAHKAEVMNNLVTEFYDYSRLTACHYEIQLNSIDAARTLKESLMGHCQILEQAGLKLKIHVPDAPVWVVGEKSALERIFLNLLQNAGRYACTFLDVSIVCTGEKVMISFLNDTDMLAEEEVSQLFDRFYMQNRSRNQGGTGLGLTVAQALAEAMEGDLKASVINTEEGDESKVLKVCFELTVKAAGK